MLLEHKLMKYLIYAIGEIFLVLVGILLALQINTLNNKATAKKQLKQIYKQIKTDLEVDTTYIGITIRLFEEKEKRIQNILDKKITPSFYDTINSLNYKNCKICISEATNYIPIKPITKGYNLLKNSGVVSETNKDILPDMIDEFYSQGLTQVETNLGLVTNVVFENIKTFENYSWFVDWQQKKYNKDFLTFIFSDESYRNQLTRYRIYYKDNYIKTLTTYNIVAAEILEQLELELKK